MTVEPFKVIDGREVQLGVLLERQIVSAFALCNDPVLARNASFGGGHVDAGKKKTKHAEQYDVLDRMYGARDVAQTRSHGCN